MDTGTVKSVKIGVPEKGQEILDRFYQKGTHFTIWQTFADDSLRLCHPYKLIAFALLRSEHIVGGRPLGLFPIISYIV